MPDDYLVISLHLGTALLAGALIGLERTFHGRPARFRTHALVALASSLPMLLTLDLDHGRNRHPAGCGVLLPGHGCDRRHYRHPLGVPLDRDAPADRDLRPF